MLKFVQDWITDCKSTSFIGITQTLIFNSQLSTNLSIFAAQF